jgi:aspartate 1-decarboxylase
MRRTLCKSKIHRATLTGADLHYEGSCTVDRELMDAADLLPFELVQVVNVNNGARLETYVIEGERGTGVVQLNGAAARLGMPGDLVIIISYAQYEDAELTPDFAPRIVFVDAHNRRCDPHSAREIEEARHEA